MNRARTIRARKAYRAAVRPYLWELAALAFGYLALAALVAFCALGGGS